MTKVNKSSIARRTFVSSIGMATAGMFIAACSKKSNPVGDSDSKKGEPGFPPIGSQTVDSEKPTPNDIDQELEQPQEK